MNENTIFQEIIPPAPSSGNDPTSKTSFLFPISKILKAIVGLLIIFVIGFGIFHFVLPLFQGNKNEKITLTYYGLWEEPNVMKAILSDFERQNPKIEVKYLKQDIKQYKDLLLTRIKNNSGPDIFRFHNTWLPMLNSALLPLSTDVITKEDFQKWYYPTVQKDVVKNGAIYGIPLEIDTLALYVNTQMLSALGIAAPKTWEDFSNAARELTVKDENRKIKTAGAALGTYNNINHAPDIVSLLMVQNGVDVLNIEKNKFSASDALDFYTSFAKGDSQVWNTTLDPSLIAFGKGNLAMYFGYSWDIFQLNEVIKQANSQIQFKIYPVPNVPHKNMTIASYWIEGVSVKSKHQKEALLLMKFLTQKETQQKLFTEASKTRLFGEPYSRTDLKDLLKDNAFLYPFVVQGNQAVSSYFVSDTYDQRLNGRANEQLRIAIESVLGNTSAQSAIDSLSKNLSQIQEGL